MDDEVAHRIIGRKSLADQVISRGTKLGHGLDKLRQAIDWNPIKEALSSLYSSTMGRASYPPLAMFQVLLLQQWYGLSDEQMEEALHDRLSFRYFCGFSLADTTPDKTTLSTFRTALAGLDINLLDILNHQIEEKGLIIKKGTLIDATVIQADTKPPRGGEQSVVDPQAGWTKKRGQYTYGYKAHIGVDEGTEFVRKVYTTSADFHDSQVFYQCISGDEISVYADKAYDSSKHRTELKQCGINDRILYRAKRNKALNPFQNLLNKLYSKRRSAVERVFGTWKRAYGYTRARYRGWEKNQLHLTLLAVAHNIKRCATLSLVTY